MIHVENLTKTYDKRVKNPAPALHGVSFTLPDTGFVCIVGPSGCGKTTLLNAVGGLDKFDGGTISTNDLKSLRCGTRATESERNRAFGYIFQSYYLLSQHSTAYNVYLGLHSLQLTHEEKLKRVTEALKAVDMGRFARREVGQLSGGQQQRVAIARALARRPKVIFADEPTGNLDEANTMNICALLRRISKTSLVVMVTHEERIARFFADRIITLEAGHLKSDSADWARSGLAAGDGVLDGPIYAGDLSEEKLEGEGLTVRLLREEGAAPAALTVVVQNGRIVVKLDDERTTSMGRSDQRPVLNEGQRPILKLEEVDREKVDLSWADEAPQGKAGSGLSFGMLMRESVSLLHGEKFQRLVSSLFLVVLTVLTLLIVGDYIKVASIRPEDFITTDSHILELKFSRGTESEAEAGILKEYVSSFNDYLEQSGVDYTFIPTTSDLPTYYTAVFRQMASAGIRLGNFSYASLEDLDPAKLIAGRMPERSDEIVVDRWVLDAALTQKGVLQNSITDINYFLGKQFSYSKKAYAPTVVGICDCGEPTIYVNSTALVSIGALGNEVITLSEFQKLFPGKYDTMTITGDDCVVVANNAGMSYMKQVGSKFRTNNGTYIFIDDAIQEEGTYASLVINDESLTSFYLNNMQITDRYFLYCPDKAAMKDLLSRPLPEELNKKLQIEVIDKNGEAWASYRAATQLRMDARQIIMVSVIALCMVLLYLLQRSRVQERIGMIAVYRLLGIPGRKLCAIFALECLLLTVTSCVPTGIVTWLVVAVITRLPDLEISLLLPWYAAAGTCVAITLVQIFSSLLPLLRLLRQPPARLAARYDL